MKRLFSVTSLCFLIVACTTNCVFAGDPPTSAEQLRSELESALKAGDSNAVLSLYYLDGLVDVRRELSDAEKKAEFLRAIWPTFATNVSSVKLSPVPKDFEKAESANAARSESDNGMGDSWEGDNGWRMRWSVPVLGMLEAYPSNKYAFPLLYGKTNGFFYIGIPIVYLAPGKSLYVHTLDNIGSYTGSWVYVKSGKEFTVNFSNKTNQFRECWGDYIKSCTVQKTSTNPYVQYQNWFSFTIVEDRTNIFESGEITNDAPFTYKRNQ